MLKHVLSTLKKSNFVKEIFKYAFSLLSFMPRKKNLIMFESFNGRQYSDNPRAIYEYIKKHYPHYKMIWSADRQHVSQFKNKDVDYVRKFSLKWLVYMATAKYWVTNSRFPMWFRKSKNTIYLQTWHGTPLKKLGIDIEDIKMPDTDTERYRKNFLKEAAKWDYLISPNAYSSHIFERAFGFHKKMIESGYPRNDFLIQENNPETIQKLKKQLNIPEDKYVILYAPTWRDNQFYKRGEYKFNLELNLEEMKKELGEDTVILLRLHYLVSEHLDIQNYKNFVYDVSKYEDIRNLYLVSDLLITDYSSVFFDYGLLNKPMLFYVYDIESYRDQLRGFYFDIEADSPGPLLKTTCEVTQSIVNIKKHGYQITENTLEFSKKFSYLEDGKATERVVKEVFNN